MRLAVLADIHGSIHALETILADVSGWAPDITVVAGDLTFRFPRCQEVLELLQNKQCHILKGNADLRVLQAPDTSEHPVHAFARYTKERLGNDWIKVLSDLPDHMYLSVRGTDDVCIAHGLPGDPWTGVTWSAERENYLVRTSSEWPSRLAKPADLSAKLESMGSSLFITAHIHRQFCRYIREVTVVNPGAGMGHSVFRNGSLMAEYLICDLVPRHNVWSFIFRQIPYDYDAAVKDLRSKRHECPEGVDWILGILPVYAGN